MGIPADELAKITSETNVVINSAASVDFNNPLPQAMKDNFYNTQHILAFAKSCPNLSVFVHVSTAYVNSNRE